MLVEASHSSPQKRRGGAHFDYGGSEVRAGHADVAHLWGLRPLQLRSTSEVPYEEFHPWGTSAYRSGDSAYEVSPRRYRYTGKERDEESGLDYHGLRYRVPWLGRWSTADPMGVVDGPNLYAYARGNPIALSDPSGGESTAHDFGLSVVPKFGLSVVPQTSLPSSTASGKPTLADATAAFEKQVSEETGGEGWEESKATLASEAAANKLAYELFKGAEYASNLKSGGVVDQVVEGNFYEGEVTAGGVIANIGVGVTPGVGQAADLRDTAAAIAGARSEPTSGWAWGGLAAAGVGWVPGFGDAAKAGYKALKGVFKAGDEIAGSVDDAFRGLKQSDLADNVDLGGLAKRRVNKVGPDPMAEGAHTVPKRDSSGKITGYTEFDADRNPVRRFRGEGKPHGGVEPPFVLKAKPGKGPGASINTAHKPEPWELPPGY